MTISTLVGYLLGRREDILEICETRSALWLGLIFVLSAGLAREYDGEDLLREPWYLLIPLAVSTLTSSLLYGLVSIVAAMRTSSEIYIGQPYRAFVSLYWLTAPLAWLYAIPVERFLPPVFALHVNLWLLAIVSIWRVLLTARVVSVLFNLRFRTALMPVLLFADVVAFTAIYVSPRPVISVMGGVRRTEYESTLLAATTLVQGLCIVTGPIWLIGTIVAAWPKKTPGATATCAAERAVSTPLWAAAVASVACWVPVLPLTQGEQYHRRQVERLVAAGEVEAAIGYMSARRREVFPPHWDPPPRIDLEEYRPDLMEFVEATLAPGTAGWVREIYATKYHFYRYVDGSSETPTYEALLEAANQRRAAQNLPTDT